MPFSTWDIGSCCCGCSQPFTVYGCFSKPYPGATVSIYTAAGGTLLGSGVTNAAGQATITFTGSPGNYWVTVTGISNRFAPYGQTLALNCPQAQTIVLTPANGYICFFNCLLPVSQTLTATLIYSDPSCDAAVTATAAGGIWTFINNAQPGGICGTFFLNAADATLTLFVPEGTFVYQPVLENCPPAFQVIYDPTPQYQSATITE